MNLLSQIEKNSSHETISFVGVELKIFFKKEVCVWGGGEVPYLSWRLQRSEEQRRTEYRIFKKFSLQVHIFDIRVKET